MAVFQSVCLLPPSSFFTWYRHCLGVCRVSSPRPTLHIEKKIIDKMRMLKSWGNENCWGADEMGMRPVVELMRPVCWGVDETSMLKSWWDQICWGVDETRYVEELMRPDMLRSWWDQICWGVDETRYVEELMRPVCWRVDETRYVEKLMRPDMLRSWWDQICWGVDET